MAWCPIGSCSTRVVDNGESRTAVVVHGDRFEITPLVGTASVAIDQYHIPDTAPVALAHALAPVNGIVRVRTTDLWEAIVVAVCGLVGTRAWSVYKRLCGYFGEAVALPSSPHYAMCPAPDVVRIEGDLSLASIGLGDFVEVLIEAADAHVKHHQEWQHLTPQELVEALQHVDGISLATAGRITADITGDFSFYPSTALAALGGRLAPGVDIAPDGAMDSHLAALLLAQHWHHTRSTS